MPSAAATSQRGGIAAPAATSGQNRVIKRVQKPFSATALTTALSSAPAASALLTPSGGASSSRQDLAAAALAAPLGHAHALLQSFLSVLYLLLL